MADPVLEQPTRRAYWLLTFRWADSIWRVTDANTDIKVLVGLAAAGLFKAAPLLEVKAVENTGTFTRKTWTIEIPIVSNEPFFDMLGNGRAHAPIELSAFEYVLDDIDEAQTLYHLEGRVTSVERSPEGLPEMARFEVQTLKAEMQRSMGAVCLDGCIWTYGDMKTCGKDITNLVEGGNLTTVSGLTATITGLSLNPDKWWHRGYIEKDGVRILIKEWIQGDQFVLSRFIPLDWEQNLPVVVAVTPGCDKKLQSCGRPERNRVESFMGLGVDMPDYNPTAGTS